MMDTAIQIEGVSFQISQSGLDALIEKKGVDLRLSSLNVQLTGEALASLLRRFVPDGSVTAEVTPSGLVVQQEGAIGQVRIELALPEIRLRVRDGALTLEGVGTGSETG